MIKLEKNVYYFYKCIREEYILKVSTSSFLYSAVNRDFSKALSTPLAREFILSNSKRISNQRTSKTVGDKRSCHYICFHF